MFLHLTSFYISCRELVKKKTFLKPTLNVLVIRSIGNMHGPVIISKRENTSLAENSAWNNCNELQNGTGSKCMHVDVVCLTHFVKMLSEIANTHQILWTTWCVNVHAKMNVYSNYLELSFVVVVVAILKREKNSSHVRKGADILEMQDKEEDNKPTMW